MGKLDVGKLDSDLLQSAVLNRIGHRRGEVKMNGGIGRDCAVVAIDGDCVISSDPITADVGDIGTLAVLVSCNDVASTGADPIGLTMTVLLPEGTTSEDVAAMVRQAEYAASRSGIDIVGGHTEVTNAVRQPVICATAFGRLSKETAAKKDAPRRGDVLLLTKSAGLEGAAVLATDRAEDLKNVLTDDELQEAKDMMCDVSVAEEGRTAGEVGTSAMHDVTEGGVFGAVWELAEAAGVGAWIDRTWIPVRDVTKKICDHYGIDPYRLISSGAMLLSARPEKAARIRAELAAKGIPCAQIGMIMNREDGVMEIADGALVEIAPPKKDELYRALAPAGV